MSKEELDNLAKIGKLKVEPGSKVEFDGMVTSGQKHLEQISLFLNREDSQRLVNERVYRP